MCLFDCFHLIHLNSVNMEKNVINQTSTHNVSLDWFFVNVCSDPAPSDVHALGAVRSYMDFCWVHAGR